MILVSYDITEDKLRSDLSEFLLLYGSRIQYSVYVIKNTDRILDIIHAKLEAEFKKRFSNNDSVIIIRAADKNVKTYGNAEHRDRKILIL